MNSKVRKAESSLINQSIVKIQIDLCEMAVGSHVVTFVNLTCHYPCKRKGKVTKIEIVFI